MKIENLYKIICNPNITSRTVVAATFPLFLEIRYLTKDFNENNISKSLLVKCIEGDFAIVNPYQSSGTPMNQVTFDTQTSDYTSFIFRVDGQGLLTFSINDKIYQIDIILETEIPLNYNSYNFTSYADSWTPEAKITGKHVHIGGAVKSTKSVTPDTSGIGICSSQYPPSSIIRYLNSGSSYKKHYVQMGTDGVLKISRYGDGGTVNQAISTSEFVAIDMSYLID